MAFGVAFQFFLVHYREGKKRKIINLGGKYYVIGLVKLFELNTIKTVFKFCFHEILKIKNII